MKVIYHCYGSSHSSVIAAAIHLGMLPRDRLPTTEEILNLPRYDKTDKNIIGTSFFMGTDSHGHEVHVIGTGPAKAIVQRAIRSVLDIYGIPQSDLLLVDALPAVGLITKIGGILSRRFGIIWPGRALTVWGVKGKYQNFLNLVNAVQQELRDRRHSLPGLAGQY